MTSLSIAPGLICGERALSANLPWFTASTSELVAFLQEVPLLFIVGFVAICLFLVSHYLLPK